MERVRHHGSTPPRKQCTPGAFWGSGGIVAPPSQFQAGFSEQLGEFRCQSLMPPCGTLNDENGVGLW